MKDVVFWGATGQAKVLNEAISDTGFRLAALIDNRDVDSPLPGVPVLRGEPGLSAWLKLRPHHADIHAVVAIGGAGGHDRLKLMEVMLSHGLKPLTITHRTAFIANDVSIGAGCQIMAQAAVCTHVQLGNGVIINTSASVDHDCVIGDGCHIAPGAHLAGEVTVGDHVFIGTGAIVLPRLHIGDGAVLGAGAVVTKSVPAGKKVIGNPARQT